jgi:serine/threonine protein kinase
MIGTLIDGCYRVDQVLGEGGFGTVYRCTDVHLERPVAVKMLHPGLAGETELRRILAEGKNLASLSHANVVHVYRLGSHEGRPYIVMEFLDGRTLAALRHEQALPLGRCLEIMHQVALGLQAIHAMGILHRDLSTHNIMITSQGTAKILDLGLSRDMGRLTTTDSRGALLGTLAYVAPEHIDGHGASVRSEVFSFGVILYEVLTGENPFEADHYMSLLYNITQRTPTPVEERVPDCPPELAGLVRECLAKQPEDRPRDMAEVERRLGELLARPGLGSGQGPSLPAAPATRHQRSRNPYLNRVMIKSAEDFIGRQQEVKRIFARLNATPPGSISIVGERKIGKSSLLNHVYMQAQRQKHLDQPEKMVMVFLDFQEQKAMSMEAFVRLLLTMVTLELRGRVDLAGCAPDLNGIKDMVQRHEAAGLRLAILLDEFDIVTTNPNFGLEFFSFLRFLANHYDVAYLTSSGRDLQMLCHTREISDSPFFNIFSTMRLSVFQREEALELIRVPSERVGLPLAPHAEQILALAGRFPFFLQMACSHAVEYLDEHPGSVEPDFGEIRRRFAQEAWLHYRYIWDGFDQHQRSALLRMAQGRSIPDALRHVVEELASKHYVDTEKTPSSLFSASFEEFIRTEAARGEKKPSLFDRLWRRPGC